MSQIKFKRVIGVLNLQLFLLAASLFAWGPDIPIWTEGNVNCFDVDYALDGSMYVVFQAAGEEKIRIYASKDHGLSWIEYNPITNPPYGTPSIPTNLKRIKAVIYEENDEKELNVFHVNADGYLYQHQYFLQFGSWQNNFVSDVPIVEPSFDIAYHSKRPAAPIFYSAWLENTGADTRRIRIFGGYWFRREWHELYSNIFNWSTAEGEKVSIAFAPPQNVFCAYSKHIPGITHVSPGSVIVLLKSSDEGVTWTGGYQFPKSPVGGRYYDPRVAAANVDEPGAWIVHNAINEQGELDLWSYYKSFGNMPPPDHYQISGIANVSEYISDVKYYKIYSCEYINMVYIFDEAATYRRAYWMWTSQSDPSNWYDKVQVNDQDVTSWPEDVAPRLVYSPGNWVGGSGVVFSYFWKQGLYFDAPWNTISGGFLIITTSEFQSALQRLVDWKNNTGIPTYLVNWESIQNQGRDKAERVKYAIDVYYRQYGVRYVMLVGDSEKFPVRYTLSAYEKGKAFPIDMLNRHWSWDDTSGHHEETWNWCNGGPWYPAMADFMPNFFCSELYYADLYSNSGAFDNWDANNNGYFGERYRSDLNPEGINLMPDVAVGRVPASTIEEVNNYVTKVINYETHAWNSDWFKRSLIFASDEDTSWTNCGKKVNSIMAKAGFNTTYVELKSDIDEPADEYVQREIPKGLGFLLYIGHGPGGIGLQDHWSESGNMLPIVCHTGCDPGDFSPNVLCSNPYRSIYGASYDSYANGQHYPYNQFPPHPDPLQPNDLDQCYPEFLLCKHSNRGAIAFYGATYATQKPSPQLGKFFFEGYPKGHKLLGDIWIETIKRYYHTHMTGLVPQKNLAFRGTTIWNWGPSDEYFMIQKFVLFGDPSLRVGGVPSAYTKVAAEHTPAPQQFKLAQNYPNPFNAETIIKYELAKKTDVSLKIYNILGQQVIVLVDKEQLPGTYTVLWDGRDENGKQMPSSIYLINLQTKDFSKTCKMTLIR